MRLPLFHCATRCHTRHIDVVPPETGCRWIFLCRTIPPIFHSVYIIPILLSPNCFQVALHPCLSPIPSFPCLPLYRRLWLWGLFQWTVHRWERVNSANLARHGTWLVPPMQRALGEVPDVWLQGSRVAVGGSRIRVLDGFKPQFPPNNFWCLYRSPFSDACIRVPSAWVEYQMMLIGGNVVADVTTVWPLLRQSEEVWKKGTRPVPHQVVLELNHTIYDLEK